MQKQIYRKSLNIFEVEGQNRSVFWKDHFSREYWIYKGKINMIPGVSGSLFQAPVLEEIIVQWHRQMCKQTNYYTKHKYQGI